MRMKHRWIVTAAVMATLVLGGCRPADSGAGESSGAEEGNTAPSSTNAAEPSASSTPYSMDDY